MLYKSGSNAELSSVFVSGDMTASSAQLAGIDYPVTDGNPNDVLFTNGSGSISFGPIPPPTVQVESGTTITIDDKNTVYYTTNASTITATMDSASNALFDVDDQLTFIQGGVGRIFATSGSGVTLNYFEGTYTFGQYAAMSLVKTGETEWVLLGGAEETSIPASATNGLPTGGTVGQVLTKIDGTDYNTEWTTSSGSSNDQERDVNSQTGLTYTLALTDADDNVTMDNPSANTVTIPANSSVGFRVGTMVSIWQLGVGTTSIAGDGGVTLNGVVAGNCDINNQYGAASALKIATDTWVISGDITTVA
jgi:hypothetical protein